MVNSEDTLSSALSSIKRLINELSKPAWYERLVDWDREHLIGRLENVRKMIEDGDYRLTNLNIYEVFDVSDVDEQINFAIDRNIFLGIAEWVRNSLVFVPVVLTWYSLGQVSRDHQSTLNAITAVSQVNAYIISVVIILTVFIHFLRDFLVTNMARRAGEIKQLLEQALWFTGYLFAQSHPGQEGSISQADARILVKEVQRERKLADLSNTVKALKDGTAELKESAQTIRSAANEIRRPLDELGKHQEDLIDVLDKLRARADMLGQAAKGISDTATNTRETQRSMQGLAQAMSDRLSAIENAMKTINQQNKTFMESVNNLSQVVERLPIQVFSDRTSSIVAAIERLTTQLKSLTTEKQAHPAWWSFLGPALVLVAAIAVLIASVVLR